MTKRSLSLYTKDILDSILKEIADKIATTDAETSAQDEAANHQLTENIAGKPRKE